MPKSGDTTNWVIATPSWLFTHAECTPSEFSANTAAALDTNPGLFGAAITTWYMRALSPGAISTCTPWSADSET